MKALLSLVVGLVLCSTAQAQYYYHYYYHRPPIVYPPCPQPDPYQYDRWDYEDYLDDYYWNYRRR